MQGLEALNPSPLASPSITHLTHPTRASPELSSSRAPRPMSQPKLTLRPPPHRDFIQGFPGIVGSGNRPPAHVAGTVEVRLGTKGLKAAWLRIELRKLETLPGGESWGELIGRGPIDVWSARKDEAHKSEAEKGWELLQTADFPFQVTIPEGLPPSAKLEKNAGIGYELVTSLCVRSKKGLLKKETTSSIIQNTHPLWLDKHELHSTWPVYSLPEDHETIQDDIRAKVMRNRTCYGPGDSVDVRVILISERVSPIKVKSVSFAIRETITFKGSAKKTFGSNKAASQKTESLSSKSKSFGKKVYKGDTHTFDLSCQIPRTHTLMTIQTAKHIEVSYTLRVQIETAKKPIIIDHLPITVSNFPKTASDALMDRIGWVPGLSTPADGTLPDPYLNEAAPHMPPGPMGRQQTIARSVSFSAGSTYSGSRSSYPGYPGGDLRRRDTVMTQGTAISGPGMAGRGVPGQVFSWGQYGSAQPFGAGDAPRPAFAGPPSIYEGRELAPEETRALFHSTNRPQSAMVLGTAVDPVLMPPSSYHGHSGAATPIREQSEDDHGQSQYRHSQYGANGYASNAAHYTSVPGSPALHRDSASASPADGRNPYAEVPHRMSATPEISATRYVRPEPVHQPIHPERQASPAPRQSTFDASAPMSSAEAEKQRLYERARQQAERNQRRADERRAQHQLAAMSISNPASPVANGGRPYSMMNLGSTSASAAPGPSAGAGNSLGMQGGPNSANSNPSMQAGASASIVSGRPAPYPSYMTAEEEKRQLYERARAETEAFQRGEASSSAPAAEADGSSRPAVAHGQASSISDNVGQLPGAWPQAAPAHASSSTPAPVAGPSAPAGSSSAIGAGATSSAGNEKEQLRRYYEARDAVNQHLQTGGSRQVSGSAGMYAPEVASAVHHATPHQPADTLGSPVRATTTDGVVPVQPTPMRAGVATTGVQSYLTEAEQQSAEEKERLASHYARKAAKAEAKAAAAANGQPRPSAGQVRSAADAYAGASPAGGAALPAGASEKAQLAAYYAARDAMQHNLQQESSSSAQPKGQNMHQWQPRYSSLDDDEPAPALAAAPPPLPPKIPLGTSAFAPSAHRAWS
ncbi:hypothetical protein PaG_04443 [Moesziomyces aphidis]|uniref:Arrestin C-terminal-like domain-containing protein n=1 Tax=Moesziomyces aphidis TaxID=84754 RepID=W3VIB1_MOEAP|nr:hypothetical protein PaG_04443 [Moesziomyces aphidis]